MAFPITTSGAQIFSLVQTGGAINPSMIGLCGSTTTLLNSTSASLLGIGALGLGLDYSGLISQAGQFSTLTASGGAISSLSAHVSSSYANLTNNCGLYIGQLNIQQGLNSVNSSLSSLSGIDLTSNPCAGLSTFFGSILGTGEGLLQTITGALQEVAAEISALEALGAALTQEAIAAAEAVVAAAVGAVVSAAASVVNMIASEAAALANALSDLLDFGYTSALQALFGNPCGKLLLQAVGTTELLGALGV